MSKVNAKPQNLLVESNIMNQQKYIKLKITIEDNGVGIAKENLTKLF